MRARVWLVLFGYVTLALGLVLTFAGAFGGIGMVIALAFISARWARS